MKMNYMRLILALTTAGFCTNVFADLSDEWTEFITCASTNAIGPKIVSAINKFNATKGKPALSDSAASAVNLATTVGLSIVLGNVPNINGKSGSDLCNLLTVPQKLMDVVPSDLQPMLGSALSGACIKALSVAVGSCDFPGSKPDETVYLLSDFSQCMAAKFSTSPKMQQYLGDKAYVRAAFEGAMSAGVFKTLLAATASGTKKYSAVTLSNYIYDNYFKTLLENVLKLPSATTQTVKMFMTSIFFTYSGNCMTAAKENTAKALAAGKVIAAEKAVPAIATKAEDLSSAAAKKAIEDAQNAIAANTNAQVETGLPAGDE